jgi:hypothetical protein
VAARFFSRPGVRRIRQRGGGEETVMAKKTYGQSNGKVVNLSKLPKGMRHVDPEWDVATFKDGPLRIFRKR